MISQSLDHARWWTAQNKIKSYADYERLEINAWEVYGEFKEQISAEAEGNSAVYDALIKELVDILKV